VRRSYGQRGGAHFVDEFARATCVARAAEQLHDLSGLGSELVRDRLRVVTVAGQLRLEIVDLRG